jgi:hypothetical protein
LRFWPRTNAGAAIAAAVTPEACKKVRRFNMRDLPTQQTDEITLRPAFCIPWHPTANVKAKN